MFSGQYQDIVVAPDVLPLAEPLFGLAMLVSIGGLHGIFFLMVIVIADLEGSFAL